MTVTPRPASTVVLMDNRSRVYLTKRPKTMKFFGGFHVFPGGAVEKSDYQIDNQFIKKGNLMESFDQAYFVTAARELFEEVGVFLSITDVENPIQFKKATEMEYRRLLMKGEIAFGQILKNEGLDLNLESLTYFGHLTTPKENPIRFDTRFFLARLPQGQEPKPDLHEIEEAVWLSPEEAFAEYKNKNIRIAPPTILALKAIIDNQNGRP